MSDTEPEINYLYARGGGPVVWVGDRICPDMPALLAAHPATAEDPVLFARAANHFSQGGECEVIEDPAAFEAAYRARLEAETPGEPWSEGVNRLRDVGIPDFTGIAAPRFEDGEVVFFARDTVTGVAYKVRGKRDGTPPADGDYSAIPLSPVEPPARRPSPPPPAGAYGAAAEEENLPSSEGFGDASTKTASPDRG